MTAIQEIQQDMRDETGDDGLFLRIFQKHRGSRITGIDRAVRMVQKKQMRIEYQQLTMPGGSETGLASAIAIDTIARRYSVCRALVYKAVFHNA